MNNDLKKHDNLNDGTEDTNHNGRIDGDNGDGIYGESETWSETSPNLQDSDGDTFSDKQEKDWGYNPLSTDTDCDGISDDSEDEDGDGELDSTETDPTKMDTDGDGLTDSQEKNGWTVVITYEATGEIKERIQVVSDPRDTDSEDDGLTDYEEFTNATNPNDDDSDNDGKTDIQEILGDYDSSPTGIDGNPPEIWKFDCTYEIKETQLLLLKVPSGLEVWMEVGAKDIFGLDNIEIFISGLEDKKVLTNNEENVTVEFEWSLSGIDEYKRAFFDGFKINVTATDRNDNVGFRNEKLDSIKDIVVSAFIGPLVAIAEFISELASGIFNWLWDMITSLVENTINLILKVIDVIRNTAETIADPFLQYFYSGFSNFTALRLGVSQFMDFLFNPIFFTLVGTLMITMSIVAIIVTGVSFGSAEIITQVISFLLMAVMVILTTTQEEEQDSGDVNSFTSLLFQLLGVDEDSGEFEGSKYSIVEDTQIPGVENPRIDNLLKGIIITGGEILVYVLTFMANGHYSTPPGCEVVSLKMTFLDHLIFWVAMAFAIASVIISTIAADFIIQADQILDQPEPGPNELDYRGANADCQLGTGFFWLMISLIVWGGSAILNVLSPLVCSQPGMVKVISWIFTGISFAVFGISYAKFILVRTRLNDFYTGV